jgi:hypothetical protein
VLDLAIILLYYQSLSMAGVVISKGGAFDDMLNCHQWHYRHAQIMALISSRVISMPKKNNDEKEITRWV